MDGGDIITPRRLVNTLTGPQIPTRNSTLYDVREVNDA